MTSKSHRNGTPTKASKKDAVQAIRQQIQDADISSGEKEVLSAMLNDLISPAGLKLSTEQAMAWIARSIKRSEYFAAEEAETDREIDAVFAAQQQ